MTHGIRVIVHLCFSGYLADPGEITEALGLEPSGLHRVGDARSSARAKHKHSFWANEITDVISQDVGLTLEEALEALSQKENAIASIAAKTTREAYLGVTVSFSREKPFINIPTRTLERLVRMSLSLDIELYPLDQ